MDEPRRLVGTAPGMTIKIRHNTNCGGDVIETKRVRYPKITQARECNSLFFYDIAWAPVDLSRAT